MLSKPAANSSAVGCRACSPAWPLSLCIRHTCIWADLLARPALPLSLVMLVSHKHACHVTFAAKKCILWFAASALLNARLGQDEQLTQVGQKWYLPDA